MALTATCPHCNGTTFEIEEIEANGARFKHYFIQCSQCGAPAGVTEYNNVGQLINELEGKVTKFQADLTSALVLISRKLDEVSRRIADGFNRAKREP